jgi:membrane fusion protein (multidrug efflux system)
MNPKKTCLTWLWLAIIFLTMPALAQSPEKKGGPPPALVRLAPVESREVETMATFTANAQAHRHLTLASRVEEIVLKGEIEEGDQVQKGQVLVRLDQGRLKLRLAETQAVLREAQAVLEQMNRDLLRQQALRKTKSVPQKNVEDAQTAVDRQQALVDRQQENVRLLQQDLNDTLVRAPTAGVVVRRLAYRGEWVKKGGPIVELAVLDPVKVITLVPERFLPRLAVGNKAKLTADALPGEVFQGRIQAIIPSGDTKSRTFPVQVRVPNPKATIKPGMLMRVTLAVGNRHAALLVPKDALVLSAGGNLVYTINKGRAQSLPVKVIAAHDGKLEVEGPLKAGQGVVVFGNERLMPGQPVKVIEPAKKRPQKQQQG